MKCKACKRLKAKKRRPEWFLKEDNVIHTCNQPERLSPEDHIVDDNKMVSDSLNTTNK